MAAAFNLGIGLLEKAPWATAAADHIVRHVAKPVELASGSDIQLKVVPSPVDFGPAAAGAATPDLLHRCLETITGYQRGRNRVMNIGLLIAQQFEPRPDFFGLMFDEDFLPSFDNPWASTPREGCAVFLGGIAARRSQSKDFMDEALYTAIHELAHVFNLQHSHAPSYMAQSAGRPRPFDLSATVFSPSECHLLSQCSTSRYIWPGGSAFGVLGNLAAANAPRKHNASSSPLKLSIRASQPSFWNFEPIELDVSLTLPTKSAAGMSVKDMLDPGYADFTIWIEEPDGQRRKNRSPRRYCGNQSRIWLAPGTTFARDVSIFGQSGGYTFQSAGAHRIWATFSVSRGVELKSNTIEVEVRSVDGKDPYYAAAMKLLPRVPVASLLYHRRLSASRARWVKAISEFCEAFPRHGGTAMVEYALGRSLARKVIQLKSEGLPSLAIRRASLTHLKAAARRKKLGDHRRQRAEQALTEISS